MTAYCFSFGDGGGVRGVKKKFSKSIGSTSPAALYVTGSSKLSRLNFHGFGFFIRDCWDWLALLYR